MTFNPNIKRCTAAFSLGFLLLVTVATEAQTLGNAIKKLKTISIEGVAITDVQDIVDGTITLPDGSRFTNQPHFVRVCFTSNPTPESNIRSEIWLPVDNWNGRFLGTGNGGGAGKINYFPLVSGAMKGFATANTDMGTSPDVLEAIGFPEKWKDFGYRATHVMTIASKIIIKAFYNKSPGYSYFVGCSTGGQQALMESQRYPDDYNGIIAGAPANNRTHLHTSFIWNLIATNYATNGGLISKKKMELLLKLTVRNCGDKAGGAPGDNFVTDPRLCEFEPSQLPHCSDDIATDSCFTSAEIVALKKLYAGPVNPRTGERIYTPLPYGGDKLELSTHHLYVFKWVYGKDFDYTTFDFDRDMAKVDSILAPVLNANNPDLNDFSNKGGKMLMYAGTNDQLVPFQDALNYYERVVENQGGLEQTQDFFRFFLIPGMAHCGGGPGLNNFGQRLTLNDKQDARHNILSALMSWVENGIAPEELIAESVNSGDAVHKTGFQRLVFPYPKLTHYSGGNPDSIASYQGLEHQRGGVFAPGEIYLK